MAKAIGAPALPGSSHRGTAALLAAWLEEHQDLLRGLIAVRALEPETDTAVQAVLNLRKVRVVRLSWELWASFTRADAADPDALLLDYVSDEPMRLGKDALFGKTPAQRPIQGCPQVRDSSLAHPLRSPGTGEQAAVVSRRPSAPPRRHVP